MLHPDLIRCILLEVETLRTDKTFGPLHIDRWPLKVVSRHVHLLSQAKLLKSFDYSSDGVSWCIPLYLTEAGENFLDAIRNDAGWEALQQSAKGEAPARQVLQLLRQLASGLEKEASPAVE